MKKLTLALALIGCAFMTNAQQPILSFATEEGGTTSNDYTYGVGRKDAMDVTLTAGRMYNSVNSSSDVLINLYQGNAPLGTWTFGGANPDYATAMEMSTTSNYAYIVGQFQGTVLVPLQGGGTTTLTSTGFSDVFIARFSLTAGSEGITWIKSVGGSGADVASDVTIDPSTGYPIIAGQFSQIADFDPGAGTTNSGALGLNDIFVLKLDLNGNFVWVETVGSLANDYAGGIDADNAGNIALGGRFGDNIDLDPGVGTANHVNSGSSEDIFITKWSSTGAYIWSHSVGANATDYINDIDFDGNGDIYAAGYFGGSFDIDPGSGSQAITAGANKNGLLWKLDGNGAHQWAHAYSSTSNNEVWLVETNVLDEVYIAGTVNGTVDFDPTGGIMNETGTNDGFLMHLFDDGALLSYTQYGNTSNTFTIRDFALSGDEYISMVGSFNGTADVDPDTPIANISSGGGTDGFLVSLYNCLPTFITPDAGSLPALSSECSVALTAVPTATNQCGSSIQGVPNMVSPITTIGTHTVTWTFDDQRGNVTTQTQSVTITDTTAPVPDVANLTGISAECQVDSVTPPTATDNCLGQITAISSTSFPITSMGTTIITWVYVDSVGNITTQQQNVTISDSQAPVPSLAQLMQLSDECSVPMPNVPFAIDSCQGVIYGTPDVSFPITTQGVTTVTWTYNDGQGNTSSQPQYVIVNDTTAPVPDVAQLPDLTGVCEVTSANVTATDNCSGAISGQSSIPFPISTIGTTVITWTFDDGNGNSSTQTQNVIISGPDTSTTVSGGMITANLGSGQYQWVDCDNGNQAISGATSQSFTPTSPGSYAVIVSNGTCADTSSCVLMANANIAMEKLTVASAYPNPANQQIEVTFSLAGPEQEVKVLDMSGKCVLSMTSAEQQFKLDVSRLASGMYLLECIQGTKVTRLRQQVIND